MNMQSCRIIILVPYANGCICGSTNFATPKIIRSHLLKIKVKTKCNDDEDIQKEQRIKLVQSYGSRRSDMRVKCLTAQLEIWINQSSVPPEDDIGFFLKEELN
jgi:hypothetical protein